jgi:hypothetical protein
MSEKLTNELPVTADPHDVPAWRPKSLHFGVLIQFTEPSGRSYSASVGREIAPGETLEKLVRTVEREAVARVIELGFPHEHHKSNAIAKT